MKMDIFCGSINNTWSSWKVNECHCDWANIITSLCSMYIAMLLIAYLRWAQDRGKNSSLPKKFFGHNVRGLVSILLLLVHLLELSDALLTYSSTNVITVPSSSLGYWASAVVLAHVLEACGKPQLLIVSAALWSLNGSVRIFRLVNLLENDVSWECLRPITAISAACLFFFIAVSEILALLIERNEKSQNELPFTTTSRYKHDQAHILSKACFHWLTPLLRAGYSCPLEAEDLGALPENHRAKTQLDRFNNILNREQAAGSKSFLLIFWKSCWIFMRWDFFLGGLLKLLGDVLSLVAPLGISAFVGYVGTRKINSFGPTIHSYGTFEDLWSNGWAVASIVLVSSIAQSTCSQASTHLVNIRAIHLNAAIQAKVYAKTLRLAKFKTPVPQDEETKKSAEDSTESGIATHLLTEDAVNIMSAFWVGHYTWAIPLKIALIMGLLYRCLGLAALVGSAVTILTLTPLQLFIGHKMSRNAAALSDITDERLQLVGSLIESIKLLKMLGWERLFCAKIQNVREREEVKLNQDSVLWAAMTLLTHVASILIAAITLAAYSWVGDAPLSPSTVFTALALFNQLTVPLFIFPVTVPIFIGAAVSGRRLATFLNQPEIKDILPKSENPPSTVKDFRPVHTIPEEFSCAGSVADLDGMWTPMEVMDNVFTWETEETDGIEHLEDASEKEHTERVQENNQKPAQELVEEDDKPALTVEDGVFLWPGQTNGQNLSLGHVTIPKGKMTILVGNIGSGKSSFLSAVLGEMQLISGSVVWQKNTTVAYAGQTPWLVNGTIRDNITFGRPFRPRRYGQVVNACALQPDLDILPAKDLTEVGERGIHLSGGQKQRIGVARALYSRANFIILDDPLSSLDNAVANQVFEAGIKRLVRRGKRTVLLATHNLNLLPHSHKVIVMEKFSIRIQGQLNDIETLDTNLVASWRETAVGDIDELVQGKTARERWQLVKLVASIGLELKQRMMDPEEEFAASVLTRKSTRRRRPAFSEWNYLSNDLPAPLEECGVVRPTWRQNYSTKRRFVTRANSLQTRHVRTAPVARQLSSPLVLSGGHRKNTPRSLLRNIFNESSKRPIVRTHQVVQRLSSTESGFSDAKSEIDPDEYDELEVGAGGGVAEEREYGNVPRRVCLLYGAACGYGLVITYALTSLAWQAARVLTDGWLSKWTEDPNAAENTALYLWIYNALSVLALLLSLASHGTGQWAGAKARVHLHSALLSHMSSCAISAIESTPAGRFINRFSSDIAVIDKKLPTSIQRLVQFVLLCGTALVVNSVLTPWFLLAGFPICLLYYCVQRFYRTSSRELQRLDGMLRSPVVSHLVETLSGLPTIRAFGYQTKFTTGFMTKLDQHTNAFLILNSSNRWLGIVLDYMGGMIVGIAMITALVTAHVTPGRVTASLAGLAINYTLLVPIYLNWVVKFLAECEMYMAAVERVNQILQLPAEEHNPQSDAPLPLNWPSKGDIKFQGVTLRYGPSSEPVFTALNLHIPAGQKVGVCGRSGSGKSTLALSLFRLLAASPGKVLLDDIDLAQVPPRDLRSRLAVVPQDAALLPGTVRENLDPARLGTDAALWLALETVKLRDLVETKCNGLDGEMSDVALSNGQRQLFCLARAVLRRAVLLVMDEASSNLDLEAESVLMTAAWKAFHGKTIIVIAHRLSTLLDCDRILVVDRGRIAEDGTPQELLSKQMGLFSTMLRASEESIKMIY